MLFVSVAAISANRPFVAASYFRALWLSFEEEGTGLEFVFVFVFVFPPGGVWLAAATAVADVDEEIIGSARPSRLAVHSFLSLLEGGGMRGNGE